MAKITKEFRQAALRRGFLVKTNKGVSAPEFIAHAAVIEFANLGFIVDPTSLSDMSPADLSAAINEARVVIGADRDMTPIYPGFPEQVEELDTLTLLVEQILHYWTFGAFLPDYPTEVREGLPLDEMLKNARKLELASASAVAREIIRQLTLSKVAISPDDKVMLQAAMELQAPDLALIEELSASASHGENLQTFVAYATQASKLSIDEVLTSVVPRVKTLDALLRVVLALSTEASAVKWESNYSLAVYTLADSRARAVRYNRISRPVRRAIIAALGRLSKGFHADALIARSELWRGVLRTVHPYDFKLSNDEKRAADIVHANIEHKTFNSLVEAGMESGDVKKVVKLLAENQPGNLLRRVVALLRLASTPADAKAIAAALRKHASAASLSTLISSYNGILSANDEAARVTRVAGLNNTMVDRSKVAKIDEDAQKLALKALQDAMKIRLAQTPAPETPVAVVSTQAVPLVKRDASTADRQLDRGAAMPLDGSSNVLRIFGHWKNTKKSSGYMDIGAVILGENFESLAVSTWDSWSTAREWSTYSGDKCVSPGDSAAEFFDVKLDKVKALFPKSKWLVMTVQSWSGWPIDEVDFIAGAMLRDEAQAGEVFDARTVATAFKPTTSSTHSVPLAFNLETNTFYWIDSSNGSTASGVSSSGDSTIGSIVYDELERPRFTLGELATLWAKAHGAKTRKAPVEKDVLMKLL